MSYKCHFCKRTFATRQEYGTHLHLQHLYGCWQCQRDNHDKADRDKHMQQVHSWLPCDVCYRSFYTEADLSYHRANPNLKRSRCVVCRKRVAFGEPFWQHCHQYHRFQCTLTPYDVRCVGFDRKVDFDAHLLYCHHFFACQYCHLVYRSDRERAEHVRNAHTQ